jgi:hypothetical protein
LVVLAGAPVLVLIVLGRDEQEPPQEGRLNRLVRLTDTRDVNGGALVGGGETAERA